MKPKRSLHWLSFCIPFAATLTMAVSAYAASDSWTGGIDTQLATAGNRATTTANPGTSVVSTIPAGEKRFV